VLRGSVDAEPGLIVEGVRRVEEMLTMVVVSMNHGDTCVLKRQIVCLEESSQAATTEATCLQISESSALFFLSTAQYVTGL